ncbi:hypothetical protein Tco_0537414 [Tanacetum coccineum]
MANLKYSDKHNMVALLKKPNESVGFTKVVHFLKGTSLKHALTYNPTIYDSLVKQFWQTATVRTLTNGTQQLIASIDSTKYIITEASVRSKLQLVDATGIHNLSDAEIYVGLATLGYVTEGKLTFWKKNFTPQWKFLIHHILHCLSPKSGGWDQFGSTIATALICLSSNRVYNFSKMIFDGMVHNLESNSKILMYPRFLQIILDITTENKGRYLAPTLTKKLFANMKRGYAGDIVPLLPAMLAGAAVDQGEGSAQPAEPHHTPVDPIPSTSQLPHSPHPSPQPHSPYQSPPHSPLPHSPYQSPPHSPYQSPPHSPPQSPPHFSPPRSYEAPLPEGNTSGSAEDSVQLKELMVLVPKLVTRINSLEKELKDTKQTLGNVVLKLVKKVKTLETALKRKSKKVLISESEGERIQGIRGGSWEAQEEEISPTILEAAKTLSKVASQGVSKEKSTDKGKRYRRRARSMAKKIDTGLDAEEEINTGREEINTGIEEVSTGSTKVDSGTASKRGQREGKAPMVEEDIQATHKTKEQMRQEEAGLEEAIKLQAQLDEEVKADASNKSKIEKKWRRTSDKLYKKLQRNKDDDKEFHYREKSLLKISETDKEESVEAMNPTPLTTKSDSVANWKIFQQEVWNNRLDDLMRVLWSDLRTMFDPPLIEDAIWSLPLQQKMIEISHSKEACQVMLKMKLLDGKMNEVCYKLLKMIEKQAGIRK